MKCKYGKIAPVTLYFNEHFLFDNKCLKVWLMISSDITVSERKKISQDNDTLLKKLKDICPQQVCDNILNNAPKIFPSCTIISNIHAKNMLYMVVGLKLLCSATILAVVIVVEGYVFIIMTICYLNIIIIL